MLCVGCIASGCLRLFDHFCYCKDVQTIRQSNHMDKPLFPTDSGPAEAGMEAKSLETKGNSAYEHYVMWTPPGPGTRPVLIKVLRFPQIPQPPQPPPGEPLFPEDPVERLKQCRLWAKQAAAKIDCFSEIRGPERTQEEKDAETEATAREMAAITDEEWEEIARGSKKFGDLCREKVVRLYFGS